MSGHLPANFDGWDREQQIDHVAFSHTRAGLIAAILSYAGVEIEDREITRDEMLTTNDLAAIYLHMEGYDR